jgi:hypothetical protein
MAILDGTVGSAEWVTKMERRQPVPTIRRPK